MRYLFLDVETGGLDFIKHSLLSLYLAVYDESGNVIDELGLLLKPADGTYRVTAEGLEVNGINIVEHNARAVTLGKAEELIKAFLKKNTEVSLETNIFGDRIGKYIHLMPVGCQVVPDIQCIKHHLPKCNWEKYVSYRAQDIVGISRFMMDCGLFTTMDNKNGLRSLADYFNINYAAHTAKGDTYATAVVFFKLKSMLLNCMKSASKFEEIVSCD